MLGINKRVQRVRTTLINAIRAKSMEIMMAHQNIADPAKIPWIDVARATILKDLADIIENIGIEEQPEDKS